MSQISPQTPPPAQAAAPRPWLAGPLFWSLLFLALLLLTAGWFVWTDWQAARTREAELAVLTEKQRANNERYAAEHARLMAALADVPCKAREHLRAAPALPEIVTGPDAGQAKSSAAQAAPDAPAKLPPAQDIRTTAELLEQATVMVLAHGSAGAGMGSGFFIAPDLVFTNAHVAMYPEAEIFVCNKATGGLLPGRVAAFDKSRGRDYALIRLDVKPGIRPLALNGAARRTDRISAWGFPGAVTGGDPKFAALLKGDLAAAPEVVFTEGAISVILERSPPLIVHSAVISQGNSGGPLVDASGAVIGINTLIRLDDASYRQSSMAITATDMIAFLREQGVSFNTVEAATSGEKDKQ